MSRVIVLVSLIALVLAVLLAALGPAYRFGLVDLATAFNVMKMLTLPTLIAAGLAALGLVAALFVARGQVVIALVAALAAGASGYAPVKMRAMAQANPFIHDITTDFDNPPAIVAAAGLPRKNPAAYTGAEPVGQTGKTVAESQRAAFPDLGPLVVSADVSAAAEAARRVLKSMNMQVLAETPGEGGALTIEAVHTSFWYGFKDDFIVRLAPQDAATRVDVRSKSRVGGSDLGANAARAKKFLAAMDAAL